MGDAYRFGVGVPKDATIAMSSYERGCGRGHAVSCMSMAGMLATGNGAPQDSRHARELRLQACRLDLKAACEGGG
jgi:TPR repeat protein